MYLGRIVETGDVNRVFNHPAHPYTQALLLLAPLPDPHMNARGAESYLKATCPVPRTLLQVAGFEPDVRNSQDELNDQQRQICMDVDPVLGAVIKAVQPRTVAQRAITWKEKSELKRKDILENNARRDLWPALAALAGCGSGARRRPAPMPTRSRIQLRNRIR